MVDLARKITAVFASTRFFYVVLGFFILQALWIALSAVYPLPFDEEFHFGLIQFFATDGSPFMSAQPTSADSFSSIIRDPSYLYHFLLSFPYRLLHLLTDSQAVLVIALRLINIALFAWALVLFRKLLLRAQSSRAFTHATLLLFVLIPIVPQLAAHVSYDNALLVLVAALCLCAARVLDGLRLKELEVRPLGALLLVGMVTSLVKFKALPIVVAAGIFVGFMIVRTFRRTVPMAFAISWRQLHQKTKYWFLVLFVVIFGLVVQRYGVNMWSYHSPNPDCAAVLSETRCQAFGPWARNHALEQTKSEADANPAKYTWTWLKALHHRLFFAITGQTNGYENYQPLPLPAAAAVVMMVAGSAALLLFWRRVFRGHRLLGFFAFVSLFYIGAMFVDTYAQFLQTGVPVAINGRYLIPVALLLAAILGRALSLAFERKPVVKPFLATLAIIFFLQGGGVLTFILRSNDSWYWQNSTVRTLNHGAQQVLAPLIIEGEKSR